MRPIKSSPSTPRRCIVARAIGFLDRRKSDRAHGKRRTAADCQARLAADHCGANASLWQTAAIGLRSLIDCDWTLLRTSAVATIIGVTW
jgi:hypothetical protein